MKEMLEKEKKLRKKGFADKQVEEIVAHLRGKGHRHRLERTELL